MNGSRPLLSSLAKRIKTHSSLTLIFLFFIPSLLEGQVNSDWCGADERREEMIESMGQNRWEEAFEAARIPNGSRGGHDTIPVVVHVIHDGGPGDIGFQQIQDGIRVLNEDFNRANDDTTDTRSVFDTLASDSRIYFRLARYTPNGTCTNGVTRTRSDLTNNANDAVKDLIRWPTDEYLNIWLANTLENSGGGTLLGYAEFPFGGIGEDYGVVMRNDRWGTIGTSNSEGRTATHEVGHCLGLFHTFQGGCGGNCSNSGDRICDTPPAAQETFGCDQTQNSCSNDMNGPSPYSSDVVDQIENYMSYDFCQNMFSKGQKNVMKGVLDNISGLQNLTSSANLQEKGVHENPLCKADLTYDERIICAGEEVDFSDISFHNIQGRTWTFFGGDPFFSVNQQNPSISYPDPGLYDVELKVTQANDTLSVKKEDLIRVLDPIGEPTPYIENMEMNPIQAEKIFPRASADGTEWAYTDRTGASGNGSLLFENYLAENERTYSFETNTIDASGEPAVALSFKVAYRKREANDNGTLKVYASKECGSTWDLRKSLDADQLKNGPSMNSYYGAENETNWKTFTVIQPLAFGYNTEGLRFKFSFTSGGGNNVYVDDINVSHPDELSIKAEKDGKDLKIFPNPARDKVYIRTEQNGEVDYALKDATGKTLRKGEFDGKSGNDPAELSLGQLSSGIYFLHFQRDGKGNEVQKLVVR